MWGQNLSWEMCVCLLASRTVRQQSIPTDFEKSPKWFVRPCGVGQTLVYSACHHLPFKYHSFDFEEHWNIINDQNLILPLIHIKHKLSELFNAIRPVFSRSKTNLFATFTPLSSFTLNMGRTPWSSRPLKDGARGDQKGWPDLPQSSAFARPTRAVKRSRTISWISRQHTGQFTNRVAKDV